MRPRPHLLLVAIVVVHLLAPRPQAQTLVLSRVNPGCEFVGEQIVGMQVGVFFAGANAER